MKNKIAILGAGAYGTALGMILASNGFDVDYYDPNKEREKLTDVVLGTSYVVLCTPSNVALRLLPFLPKEVPLIVASKGFLVRDYFDKFMKWMIFSGPGYAEDLKNSKKIKITITDKCLEEIFSARNLSFDYTDDKIGVLLCGALKNVYAIMAGYLGLSYGSDKWSDYIMSVSSEIRTILSLNGADSDTFSHSCGKNDLMLTCNTPSRNYDFGKKLKKGVIDKNNQTIEGITVLNRIKRGEIMIPSDAVYLRDLMKMSFYK